MKIEQPPVSQPPQAYLDMIEPLIAQAKGFLEDGIKLPATAFVGNFTTKEGTSIYMDPVDDRAKDEAADKIKRTATLLDADFVFTIMEAWSLRPDKVLQMNAILDKYGSIGQSPYKVDVCSFMLETAHGVWQSLVPIKPKGISKKKRTIGPVEFRRYTETQGRFANLLPNKEGVPITLPH